MRSDGGSAVVFRVRYGQGFLNLVGSVGRRPTRKKFRAPFVRWADYTQTWVWGAPPEKTKAQPARKSRAVRRI